jgi:hypothetical protein
MRKQLVVSQFPQYQRPRRWRMNPLERLEMGVRYYKKPKM